MSRILFADDEPDLVDTCVRFLESFGHTCIKAYDGGRAMELIDADPPDLVITGLRLPVKDGLEIARRIRQSAAQTPVIVITAYHTPETAVAAYEAGATAYLPKPFSLAELTDAVNRALSTRRW